MLLGVALLWFPSHPPLQAQVVSSLCKFAVFLGPTCPDIDTAAAMPGHDACNALMPRPGQNSTALQGR